MELSHPIYSVFADAAAVFAMIQILLSTYQGELFLPQQLESLQQQTKKKISLLARDDGSSDQTKRILEQHNIPTLNDTLGNLRPAQSFAQLLQASHANYVLCCDQDDIWQPQKLEQMQQKMQQLETSLGKQTPILLHHDLEVVTQDLETIAPSLWAWRGLDVQIGAGLHRLLLQNVVTGCAMMANRALLEQALPIPPEAVMHDWWLALVAAAFGHIEAMPQPLVRYRQHGQNSLGARQFGMGFLVQNLLGKVQLKPSINARLQQAKTFAKRYENHLTPQQLKIVTAFATLRQVSWLERRRLLQQYDFRLSGTLKNLAWWCAV
jgi:glycosyltransferase involved in cell wall biosynthesis